MKKHSTVNFQRPTSNRGALTALRIVAAGLLVSLNAAFAAIEADLLAAYAPSYASSVGGEDNAQVILANTVMGNNVINDQSGTGARMRIAGFYQSVNDPVNWTTTGGMVGWLANNDSRVADVVSSGSSVGADLVTYVCQNSDSGSIAAVAQQPGMYSALNPGAVWSAVFAHETGGHNYGRSHSDGLLSPKTVMLHNYCSGGAAPPYFFTNPNIWFNGVQLQGDGNNCSQGSLINGGDNSAPSAQAVADRRARILVGPNLNNVVLRWSFTNAPGAAPAGTIVADKISAAPAVVRGNGAAFTGSALRIPGGTTGNTAASSISAYIDLPNGILSSRTNITIEIWATPLSAPNWARLCDFGRTVQAGDGLGAPGEYTGTPGTAAPGTTQSSDDIMLSAAVGTDINSQRFEAKLNGGAAVTLDSGLATTAGVPHHYAITFTDGAGSFGAAGGRWQWFRDGDAVAFLDVGFHLADLEDVNNWLGRSMWSGDAMANNDYAEVRISDVAMSRGEVLANYLLGPNYVATANVTLTNSDAAGTTSFNAPGQWSNGLPPLAGNSYETHDFQLRTPVTGLSQSFGGDSLKISGGALLFKGTSSSTITVNNLTLNGGEVSHAGSGTFTLAGSVAVTTNGATFNGVNGATTVSASLSGVGPVEYLANATTLSGNNSSFTGRTRIGNGAPGTLVINSPVRLGASPVAFTSDQLTLNRGTLQTTATMSLSHPNHGILLDVSGGTFNVASGTTLTLASPLSSPVTAANVVAGSLRKTGAGTLVLNSSGTAFKGAVWVDTGSTSGNDGVVRVANNQVLANARSPIFIRNNNSGSSTLQLDGSSGNITLPQGISLNGRTVANVAIQNVAGINTISGGVTINVGGSFYILQSDAGLLNLGGTISSSATGTRTITFQGSGGINVPGVIANGGATVNVTRSGSGTLMLGGVNTYTGTTTVSGGTLVVNGSISSGAVTVASAGTLGGNGIISGPVTMQMGSTLSPGTSIGKLTLNNDLALNTGSFTVMELNRATSTNDALQITGLFTRGGTLIVTNAGPTLLAGDSFDLFNAGVQTGAFSSVSLPPLQGGLRWNTNSLDSAGIIVVEAVASPLIAASNPGGTNLVLEFNSQSGVNYVLQSATNLQPPVVWFNEQTNSGTGGLQTFELPVSSEPKEFFRLMAY